MAHSVLWGVSEVRGAKKKGGEGVFKPKQGLRTDSTRYGQILDELSDEVLDEALLKEDEAVARGDGRWHRARYRTGGGGCL